ncbi:MAG: DMT family transporter [Gemmatimonadales bacterium]|nr:DMT family transporter [Gemmatimonadales bacterium]
MPDASPGDAAAWPAQDPAADRQALPSAAIRGMLWMVVAQACFALMNLGARFGGRSLHWTEVGLARFLLGAAVAFGVARTRGVPLVIMDQRAAWSRSVFGTISAVGVFVAVTSPRIPLGDAATLAATTPIFVALLAPPILGEPLGKRTALAVLLSFAGVVAVVQPTFEAAADIAAIATLGAFCFALALLSLRRLGAGERPEAIVLHFSVVASVAFGIAAAFHWRTPGAAELGWLLLTGIAAGAAQLAMTRAFALDQAAPITALSALGVVFTHLLAGLFLGERPGPLQLGGTLLVLGAGVMLALGAGRRSAATRERQAVRAA